MTNVDLRPAMWFKRWSTTNWTQCSPSLSPWASVLSLWLMRSWWLLPRPGLWSVSSAPGQTSASSEKFATCFLWYPLYISEVFVSCRNIRSHFACEFFMRHNIPRRERYPGKDSSLETLGHDILWRSICEWTNVVIMVGGIDWDCISQSPRWYMQYRCSHECNFSSNKYVSE